MAPVRVPQPLDRFRPVRDFLDLVDRQNKATFRTAGIHPGLFPMTHQPPRVSFAGQGNGGLFRERGCVAFRAGNGGERSPIGLVDRQITTLSVDPLQNLPDERGLARLARSR